MLHGEVCERRFLPEQPNPFSALVRIVGDDTKLDNEELFILHRVMPRCIEGRTYETIIVEREKAQTSIMQEVKSIREFFKDGEKWTEESNLRFSFRS
jgi:hypothetical protein